jgi:hypothetical protein
VSGPEGTPNGVDRLAQIAERPIAKIPYSKDGTYIALTVEERDTLVEIAKAAREQAHEHPDEQWGYDAVGIHVYDGPDNAGKGCPQCDALAGLVGWAAEEDA